MNKYISFLMLALIAMACSVTGETDRFVLEGELEGLGDKKIRFSYHDPNNHSAWLNDTIQAKNNKFRIEGKVTKADWAYIYILDTTLNVYLPDFTIKGEVITLYLTNDRIKVKGRYDEGITVELTGNQLNEGRSKYANLIRENSRRDKQLLKETLKAKDEEELKRLKSKRNKAWAEVNRMYYQFIIDNPDLQYSSYMLYKKSYKMKIEEVEKYYSSFTEEVKNSNYGKIIGEKIKAAERSVDNAPAIDFNLPDKDGNQICLSDFKGKVVLLDFWGSWCAACRASHPHLRELYSKYKNKGFEIIGIAKDRKRQNWLNAIEEDKMTWLQINGLDYVDKINLVEKYYVNAFPTKILIDKQGRIAFRLIGSDKEEAQKLDEKIVELLAN